MKATNPPKATKPFSTPMAVEINDAEFLRFQMLLKEVSGITLSDLKKALVSARLASRLRHREARTFSDYYRIITHPSEGVELQAAIDLLTTNETSFFREAHHF